MATQNLSINLTIPIPSDSVLISKVELEQLQQESLTGTFWTMKDLEQRTNRQSKWLKEHIFFRPQFRKKLDSENGGFVFYPKSKGQTWAFQATKMAAFLDKHFQQIFEEDVN